MKDLIAKITWYYGTKSRQVQSNNSISGTVLPILSIILFKIAAPMTFLRGLSTAPPIWSLIFVVGRTAAALKAKNAGFQKSSLYHSAPDRFLANEQAKVEHIQNSWSSIRLFSTLFLVSVIIFTFSAMKAFWSGAAVGLMIIGTTGYFEEAFSNLHNSEYRVVITTVRS